MKRIGKLVVRYARIQRNDLICRSLRYARKPGKRGFETPRSPFAVINGENAIFVSSAMDERLLQKVRDLVRERREAVLH